MADLYEFKIGDVLTRQLSASVAQTAATLALLAQAQHKPIEPTVAVQQAMDWMIAASKLVAAHLVDYAGTP